MTVATKMLAEQEVRQPDAHILDAIPVYTHDASIPCTLTWLNDLTDRLLRAKGVKMVKGDPSEVFAPRDRSMSL